jgi:DNA-binding transcriptional regulator LsrR (DeoR family)
MILTDRRTQHKDVTMPARTVVPVERIRQLLVQGLTQQQIALRMAVNKTSVCKVAREMKERGR